MSDRFLHDRGERYSDGGVTGTDRVFYPDPVRMARIDAEWAEVEGQMTDRS